MEEKIVTYFGLLGQCHVHDDKARQLAHYLFIIANVKVSFKLSELEFYLYDAIPLLSFTIIR